MPNHERGKDESFVDYILRTLSSRTSGAIDIRALSIANKKIEEKKRKKKEERSFGLPS